MKNENLKILCTDEKLKKTANDLAKHLNTDVVENSIGLNLFLKYDENGLSLCDGKVEVRGDFSEMKKRLKQSNLEREYLVKAAKIKNKVGELYALDATAGLGTDSVLLAASGFNVTMFEKDPIIAALLDDAIKRAECDDELCDIVKRIKLIEGNSIDGINKLENKPDVILLDPMFPERQKNAQVKKKFQILHRIEMPCDNEEELLNAAMAVKPLKIVIKRPIKGPYLAGKKPSYSLIGNAIRYDCISF